jgi:hypothetical protein
LELTTHKNRLVKPVGLVCFVHVVELD